MGLGTKIKEALRGDEHEPGYDSTHKSQMPGSFQNEELPQRHSDGKPYTAPHGTMVGKDGHTGTAGATSGLNTSDKHHNKLHRDVDEYGTSREGHHTSNTGHRSTDSGVGLAGGSTSPRDPAQKDTAYWGDLNQPGQGTTARDLPERSGLRGNTAATSGGHHDGRLADQAVGGGVYNSVTGTGSPEHTGTRPGHSGGLTGGHMSSGAAGNTYDKTDLRGEGAPTSRNDRTGPGLAGAGTAAGAAGAAGYAAHELGHKGHGNTGYGTETAGYSGGNSGYTGGNTGYSSAGGPQSATSGGPAPGMPRSSMLDPEGDLTGSSSQYNTGSHPTGAGVSSATGTGVNPTTSTGPTSSTTGEGNKAGHFGPGHEGSKVLHTCEHCGRDNDISRYFSKDVVYRLGQ